MLELRGLSKAFGPTQALDGVDLSIRRGRVHALIGQNGSGKSTLIKILSGYHVPDAGTLEIQGRGARLPFKTGEARSHGLSFLHQDLGLAPGMTVLENLRLGRFDTTAYGRLRWKAERKIAQDLLEQVDLDIDPLTPVRRLSSAERALVAFLRARQDLEGGVGLLVLDEPTAYLPGPAVELLFDAIRRLTRQGSSVLFVSHRLDEVLQIADEISVLRNGRMVGSLDAASASRKKIVELLLGRELGELYPEAGEHAVNGATPVLRVRELAGEIAAGVTFQLHAGEILGATGLLGMGHDEIPYLVFGARQAKHGEVEIAGKALHRRTPTAVHAEGVALLPADRTHQSGTAAATVLENLTLPDVGRYFRRGRIRHRDERSAVHQLLLRFGVQPADPDRRLATLSGGNQQKALLAKWLHGEPRVLLLHEPTQGVDIGSRKQLFSIIRDLADKGMAVLIASAEYEDLAHMCDRVLVMRHGRIVSELRGEELTEQTIVQHCYLASERGRSDPTRRARTVQD